MRSENILLKFCWICSLRPFCHEYSCSYMEFLAIIYNHVLIFFCFFNYFYIRAKCYFCIRIKFYTRVPRKEKSLRRLYRRKGATNEKKILYKCSYPPKQQEKVRARVSKGAQSKKEYKTRQMEIERVSREAEERKKPENE